MEYWTDKPNPEFERWWATKAAEGYQYGREALENVRFGFEGAQETRWQPIETAPRDNTPILRPHVIWGPMSVRFKPRTINNVSMEWTASDYSISWPDGAFAPYWMPLPEPPEKPDGSQKPE